MGLLLRIALSLALLTLVGCGRLGFASDATTDGSSPGDTSIEDAGMDSLVILPDGRVVPTDSGPTDGGATDGGGPDGTLDGGFETETLVCGSPLASSAFALGLAEAWCVGFLSYAEPFTEFFLFGDLANCTEFLRGIIMNPEFGVTALLDAIGAGNVLYDASEISECLCSSVIPFLGEGGPLEPLSNGGGACRSAFQGTIPLGGDCTMDFECMSDGICVEGRACGVCTARTPVGSSCTFNGECERGTDFGGFCEAGRCVEARLVEVPSGGTCDAPFVVGDVAMIGICPAGEICSLVEEMCLVPPGPGEPCTTACALGHICAEDVCTRIEISRSVGDPCDDGPSADPIRLCDLFSGLECGPTGMCECPVGTCTRSGAIGEACGEIFECEVGAYCDGGVCAARVAAGGVCSTSEQCQSGVCEMGMCRVTYCQPLALPDGGMP